jgi:hypothetical protein
VTRLHLKYVQSYRGYHYFRRRGSPYIQLPGVVGSAEFMEAYQRALAAAPVAIGASKRSTAGSISAAIADYYGSQAFRSLTGAHQRSVEPSSSASVRTTATSDSRLCPRN